MSAMTNAKGWRDVSNDPTAGVTLWPKRVICPRCGLVKGTTYDAKPGICRDCSGSMKPAERRAWGQPRPGGRRAA